MISMFPSLSLRAYVCKWGRGIARTWYSYDLHSASLRSWPERRKNIWTTRTCPAHIYHCFKEVSYRKSTRWTVPISKSLPCMNIGIKQNGTYRFIKNRIFPHVKGLLQTDSTWRKISVKKDPEVGCCIPLDQVWGSNHKSICIACYWQGPLQHQKTDQKDDHWNYKM